MQNPVSDPARQSLFRECLSQFPTGVAIVTTVANGRPSGMTINSFSSLSLDPLLVLWSIRLTSTLWPTFGNTDAFAINILAADQLELAKHFAQKSEDRFSGVEWHGAPSGQPIFDGVAAWLECRLHRIVQEGDHAILIGQVEEFQALGVKPLVFSQGFYSVAESNKNLFTDDARMESASVTDDEETLLDLLHRSSSRLSREFNSCRATEKLNQIQSRILGELYRSQPAKAAMIFQKNFVEEDAGNQALRELKDRKLIRGDDSGNYVLTAKGEAKWLSLLERAMDFYDQQLGEIPGDDVETTIRVLKALTRDRPFPAARRVARRVV